MSVPESMARSGRQVAATRLLLIGGEPSEALAVKTLLESEGYEVRHRFLAAEAVGMLSVWEPSLVMLCLQVSDMDAGELCRSIREKYSCPILAVSTTSDERVLIRALDEGADDVLAKPLRDEELKARVRALLRRSRTSGIASPQIVCGALQIDVARRKVIVDNEPVALTRTEFDILLFLALHPDSVHTQETILRAVWGVHHGQYIQTLRVHIGHIRQKIERDPTQPRYILTEPGVGYLFADPPSNKYSTAHR